MSSLILSPLTLGFPRLSSLRQCRLYVDKQPASLQINTFCTKSGAASPAQHQKIQAIILIADAITQIQPASQERGCQKRIHQVGKPLYSQIYRCCKLLQNVASMLQDTKNVAETDRDMGIGEQRNQRLEKALKITISEH